MYISQLRTCHCFSQTRPEINICWPCLFPLSPASCGTRTPCRCALTTTWTSSAPTTSAGRSRPRRPSATSSTWWNWRTTRPASRTRLTSCAGSAPDPSPLTRPRSSQRSSSASRPSLWARSSGRERAITISVSQSLNVVDPAKTSLVKKLLFL